MDFIAEGVGSRAWQYHVSFTHSSMFFACFHQPSAFQIPALNFSFSSLPVSLAPEAVWTAISFYFFCIPFPVRLMLIGRI